MNRRILSIAVSAWNDGDTHSAIVVETVSPEAERDTFEVKLDLPELPDCEDPKVWARRALCAVLAEL